VVEVTDVNHNKVKRLRGFFYENFEGFFKHFNFSNLAHLRILVELMHH